MLLSDLLELPILRDAGVRVVAGQEHLDRKVGWVHAGEIADIARFLGGGEVLLTAATGLKDPRVDRRRYVSELAEAGAAAVIIELGRTFREIPSGMVEEATRGGLVMATLEREVPFVSVTQLVHTQILSDEHRVQDRAVQIGDDFSRLVLDGAHVPAMLDLLAERLQNPVVLEDGSRHVVAIGHGGGPIAPVLKEWHKHSRQAHQGQAVGVQIAESEPRCAWSSVALRGEIWGRLHVLEVDTPLDSVTRLALGRAASNIALHLLAERDAYLSETAERSLITEIVQGSGFSGDEFLARATGLGVDFDGDLVMLVISGVSRVSDSPNSGQDEDAALADTQRVRDAFRDAGWPSLVGSLLGEIAAVASASPPQGIESAVGAVVGALDTGHRSCHLGVSRPTRVSLLRRAYSEAEMAHQLGPMISEQPVHNYDELVVHRLLAPLSKTGPHLANFVESELGELIAHDEEHHSGLLHTLDVYLQSNGSKASTAEALYLQRRSVYYRLTRIEQLLGRSIEPADHRVRLYLALRAREVLEARALGDTDL